MENAAPRNVAANLGIGRLGIWSSSPRYAPDGLEATRELEAMGFPMIWVPGGVDNGVLTSLDTLLDATSTVSFGTGVLNIWMHEAQELAAWWLGQSEERRQRLVMGLGVSHGPLIGEAYAKQKPLPLMRSYLDSLEAAGMTLERICLGGLGPKMLELSATRTAGSHPYLVSATHTAAARALLGPDALLAPEQSVVLEADPAKAREIARGFLSAYAALPNYANTWLRDGFTQEEIDTVSDRLVDALIAWGDIDAIGRRVEEHYAAGADHVALQVVTANGFAATVEEQMPIWRALSTLL